MSIEQEQSANSFNCNPNPKSNICILFADYWNFAVYLVNIRISVIRISRIVWKNSIRIRLFTIRIRFGNSRHSQIVIGTYIGIKWKDVDQYTFYRSKKWIVGLESTKCVSGQESERCVSVFSSFLPSVEKERKRENCQLTRPWWNGRRNETMTGQESNPLAFGNWEAWVDDWQLLAFAFLEGQNQRVASAPLK